MPVTDRSSRRLSRSDRMVIGVSLGAAAYVSVALAAGQAHQHHCWSAATIQQVCNDGGSSNHRSAELERLTEGVGRKTRGTAFPTITISPDDLSQSIRRHRRRGSRVRVAPLWLGLTTNGRRPPSMTGMEKVCNRPGISSCAGRSKLICGSATGGATGVASGVAGLVDAARRVRRQTLEHVLEIAVRIVSIELRGLDEAHDDRCASPRA
jgi:hypothetical protein